MGDTVNGRKIDSPFGNVLTEISSFALKKLSAENVMCITRPETVLQVLALVRPRLTPRTTNRARTCKMTN
jgi:hypothetical protein